MLNVVCFSVSDVLSKAFLSPGSPKWVRWLDLREQMRPKLCYVLLCCRGLPARLLGHEDTPVWQNTSHYLRSLSISSQQAL